MATVRRRQFARWGVSLWLLGYVAAGLLVHAPIGHVHHDATCAAHHHHDVPATTADGHEHSAAGGHHHEHDHGTHQHGAADHAHLFSGDSHDHQQPAPAAPYDEDCAGCQLLGSLANPAPAVVIAASGTLVLPAQELAGLPYAEPVDGLALARAPPVLA